MDLASIIELVGGILVMLIGIATSGGLQTISNFLDIPSVSITFGGAFLCVLGMNKLEEYVAGLKTFKLILKIPQNNVGVIVKQIVDLSNTARKEGLLALEESAEQIEDVFLKKGLLLIVDGTEPELVKSILEAEIDSIDSRHKSRIKVWEDIGSQGPAWGMIGTLIGLVNMLKNMSDAASIGPSMATALITTFYGSVLANYLCAPVANKLKVRNNDEFMMKSIMLEGILSIQAGENPRVTEEKLKSFMSPNDKKAYEVANAEPDTGEGGEG